MNDGWLSTKPIGQFIQIVMQEYRPFGMVLDSVILEHPVAMFSKIESFA